MATFNVKVLLPDKLDIDVIGETLYGQKDHPEAAKTHALLEEAWDKFPKEYTLSVNTEDERGLAELRRELPGKKVEVYVHFDELEQVDDTVLDKRMDYLLELISHNIMDTLDIDRFNRGSHKPIVQSAKA